MIVKSDTPRSLVAGLQTIFHKSYIETPTDWQQLCTTIPSTKDTEEYNWLSQTPKMREWKDERVPKGLSEYDFTIKNKKWEASMSVDRDLLEDDQYGQIKVRIQELGAEAKRHPSELISALVGDGDAALCYDGQYFFDTDHKDTGAEYTTNQSNHGTTAFGKVALQNALTAMRYFRDDRGRVLNVVPDTLVVPPDLQWTAQELLNSAYYPEEGTTTAKLATNVLKGILKLVVMPIWDTSADAYDTNNWYLFYTGGFVKPFIFQNRVAPEFQALEDGTDAAFHRDEWYYGVRARYNAGYGNWRYGYASIVT